MNKHVIRIDFMEAILDFDSQNCQDAKNSCISEFLDRKYPGKINFKEMILIISRFYLTGWRPF